jgi:hypothetical protein
MPLTLNGTTGIAGANGSASTPAVQGEDTNTGVFFPAADAVAVATGGSERLRVDSSGNVGIGTSSPTNNGFGKTLQVGQAGAWVAESGSNRWWLASNWYLDGSDKYINNGFATIYSQQSGNHIWFTAPSGTAGNAITFTQAMTLDASGNLLVGTTTSGGAGGMSVRVGGFTPNVLFNRTSTTATSFPLEFQNNGSIVGYVSYNDTATSYVTSSDYRLKENVQPMQDALAKIAQLNPVTYTWKANGSDGQGFIAHELQAVVPDCVSGEKDAVDAEGNPQYQGVDTSFLVATLVKAVQELTARIAALEAAQ